MKTSPQFVVGHRNPDTDAIVSAHVLAWLLNERDAEGPGWQALRLGEPPPQTRWLFAQAGEPLPVLRTDCRATVGEVALAAPIVPRDAPLEQALRCMRQSQVDVAVVVDERGVPMGIVGENLPRTAYLMQSNVEDFLGTYLHLQALINGLQLQKLNEAGFRGEGSRFVLATSSPEVLCASIEAGDLLLVSDDAAALEALQDAPLAAVIVAGTGKQRAMALAQGLKAPAYYYEGSVVAMVSQLPGCFPCEFAMEEQFAWLNEDEILAEVAPKLARAPHALPVLKDNGSLVGLLSPRRALAQEQPRLCLVDHSERGQSIGGLEDALIVEIVDHHRLGDIETVTPVVMDCRPVGSTASILALRAQDEGIELPAGLAKLLLGALVSDTLLLNSPTATAADRRIAQVLAEQAQVGLQPFGLEVLRRNDRMTTELPHKLVGADCKEFRDGPWHFLISQIETIDLSQLDEARRDALTEAMRGAVMIAEASFGLLVVTDVLAQLSRVFIVKAEPAVATALLPEGQETSARSWDAPGWVSRKKQVLPYVLQTLRHLSQNA